jgi:hypothetical protein
VGGSLGSVCVSRCVCGWFLHTNCQQKDSFFSGDGFFSTCSSAQATRCPQTTPPTHHSQHIYADMNKLPCCLRCGRVSGPLAATLGRGLPGWGKKCQPTGGLPNPPQPLSPAAVPHVLVFASSILKYAAFMSHRCVRTYAHAAVDTRSGTGGSFFGGGGGGGLPASPHHLPGLAVLPPLVLDATLEYHQSGVVVRLPSTARHPRLWTRVPWVAFVCLSWWQLPTEIYCGTPVLEKNFCVLHQTKIYSTFRLI